MVFSNSKMTFVTKCAYNYCPSVIYENQNWHHDIQNLILFKKHNACFPILLKFFMILFLYTDFREAWYYLHMVFFWISLQCRECFLHMGKAHCLTSLKHEWFWRLVSCGLKRNWDLYSFKPNNIDYPFYIRILQSYWFSLDKSTMVDS